MQNLSGCSSVGVGSKKKFTFYKKKRQLVCDHKGMCAVVEGLVQAQLALVRG